jgi:hypothetical protein
MIQFNLAVLLKDTGAYQAARNAFAQTLQQRPDFTPAAIALQQLK